MRKRIGTLLSFLLFCSIVSAQTIPIGHFTINRISAPYFVVDGNSPGTITKAYVGFEVKNNASSGVTYNRLTLSITSITSSVPAQTYTVLSPANGQTQIGTLAPGESRVCYYYVSYPANVSPTGTFNLRLTDANNANLLTSFTIYNRSSISANAGGLSTQNIINQDVLGGFFIDDVTYTVGNSQNNDELDFQVSVSPQFDPTRFRLVSTTIVSSTVNGVATGTTDSLYFRSGNGGNAQQVTVRWKFVILSSNFTTYLLPYAGATSGNTNYKYALNSALGANGTAVTITAPMSVSIQKTTDQPSYLICDTAQIITTIKNNSAFDISLDSILDELPSGFSYIALSPASDIQEINCIASPTNGQTGLLVYAGGVSANNPSFFIPAGDSIQLIYTARASCAPASNLTTSVQAFIGTNAVSASATVQVVSVIPVRLIRFDGIIRANHSVLSWQTANESDIFEYQIQRSSDQRVWMSVGAVKAQLRPSAFYQFTDVTSVASDQWYRLRIVEANGQSNYSRVIHVKHPEKKTGIQLMPNRTNDQHLHLLVDQKQFIRIIDAGGRTLLRQFVDAKPGVQRVYVPGIKTGIYLLITSDGTQSFWY
jgi:hypothetical protein